ncbi:MAG: hypothetical protein CTY35_13605 [Methylotenera sp.]|nr:MAG: hypothetical protein CTY35_13605 [Methylotenera sp.]
MDNEMGYIVTAPIFMLMTEQKCSLCDESNNVVLLATLNEPREKDDLSAVISGEVFILNYIETLPDDLYTLILDRHPNYRIEHSLTAGADYYMTVCGCGGHYGDHYVSNKISETMLLNPSTLNVQKLINEGCWSIPCNYSYGSYDSNLLNKAL